MNREENRDFVRCRYCNMYYRPDRKIFKGEKKMMEYIECPRCGNGYYQRHMERRRKYG